jgi:peroxiredoxin
LLDAEILGISMDNIFETVELAETIGVKYKLLSDPDGKVVKLYGVYNLLGDGVATPAVFIIGPGRNTEWKHVGKDARDRPSAYDILARLKQNLL